MTPYGRESVMMDDDTQAVPSRIYSNPTHATEAHEDQHVGLPRTLIQPDPSAGGAPPQKSTETILIAHTFLANGFWMLMTELIP